MKKYRSRIKDIYLPFIQQFSLQALALIVSILMTRLMTVKDYGYLAIIGLIFTFPNLLINISIEKSILAKHFIKPVDYSTYLLFNILLSSFLYLVIVLSSGFLERFFHLHDLGLMLVVMGLSLLFDAITQVYSVKLLHENNVLLRGKIFIASSIFGSISALFCLCFGFGLWSYVIMVLAISICQFVLHLTLVRFELKWKFKWTVLYVHLRKNAITFVSFFFEGALNSLYTYVLATFSFSNLAFYTRGDSLSKTFAFNISSVLDKNYISILNNAKSQAEYLSLFSSIRVNLFVIMILATAFLYCSSSYMFSLLFGEKWIIGGLTFQYLVLAAFFIPTDKLFINLCFSRLDVKTNLYINLAKFVLLLFPCLFVFYDFKFFLVSIIISRLTMHVLNNFLLRKFFNFVSVLDIYAVIILFVNIVMIECLGILAINYFDSDSNILNISIFLFFSGIFYLLNKYFFHRFNQL